MKVLIVASKFPPEYTGPGVRIPRLYQEIGHILGIKDIHVLCNGIEYTKNEPYVFEDMQVERISFRSSALFQKVVSKFPNRIKEHVVFFFETMKTLKVIKKQKDVDYVHILGNSGATAAAIHWANKREIPILMELVTAEARPWQRFLLFSKVRPRHDSLIVALTKRVAEICERDKKLKSKIWCRPNPIDNSVFFNERDQKQSYRKKLTPFDTSDTVICSVAKIMPQKNQYLLVRMMRYLPQNYKLVIAGPLVKEGALFERDAAYLNEMRNFITDNNLEDRVYMHLGFVKASDYMKASDIYMMPAWNEGFGTPMIEAMACGLPVIANKDEIAFQEWVKSGENGYLCDINSEKDWAEAVQNIADMPEEKRSEMSQNILSLAAKSKINDQYMKLINEMLKKD